MSTGSVTTASEAIARDSASAQSAAITAQAEPTPAPIKGKKLINAPSAGGQENQGPIVKEIEVVYVGPKSVNKSVITANMRTTIGQPFSAHAVEEDVRNLFATGLFVNLRITSEPLGDGVKVVVVVQPKPLVKEIIVVGAAKLKESVIRKEIKTKVGSPLSEQQVSADADKIREKYQAKGYDKIQVNYKIDINEEFGRAVITFTIREGTRAYVTHVEFLGNNNIPDKELRKQLKTRKKNLFSIFNDSGLFKDEQFKEDLKKIRDYYTARGYIDVQIKDVKFEYPKKDQMTLTITIFEGIQYKVGTVSVSGNSLFSQQQIFARMAMLDGKIFSPQGLEKDIKAIKDLYGEKGYIDTNIRPERVANVESGRMDLQYSVNEGAQSYVEKIVIQGNNRTKDKVIRRELALAPGEVYDSVRADASKSRLENLGYFNKVDVSPQDTAVPNRKNMVVTVEEKRTGSVTFGAGFSSVDSLLGFVELSQGNFDFVNWPTFVGAGQKFRTRMQYGLRRRDFLISFTEPWFMNQRLSLGFDLFAREAQFLSSLYDQRNIGTNVRLAKALNQFWTLSARYQVENIDLFDFDDEASPELRREQGGRTKSALSVALLYDTRDNVFLTRKGERVEFTAEVAGGPLLLDTHIYKFQAEAQKYFLLPWDIIVMLGGSTGVVDRYNKTEFVPIFDRYFLGGARSVRGFDNREVGPRDSRGEPLGGNTFGQVNFELTFPLIDRVRGAVFVDAGFVDHRSFHYNDSLDLLNIGAGVGLRLNLPIGPLRLDYGVPVRADKFNDSSGKFSFDVGYQF